MKRVALVLAVLLFFQGRASSQKHIHPLGGKPLETIHNFVSDVIRINRYIFTRATMQVITPFIPLYIGARIADEPLHCSFYNSSCHENLDEPHANIVALTEGALIVPTIVLSGFLFASASRKTRIAGGVAIAGMASALLSKEIVKQMASGRRPYNQHFCKEKNVYNGFPSGHTIFVSYLVTYYGLTIGPKMLVPLGIAGGLLAGLTIRCNKHYISQVVAGAALGTAYGVASYQLFNDRVACSRSVAIDCSADAQSKKWRVGLSRSF